MLSAITLSVIMPSVIMVNAVMVSVIVVSVVAPTWLDCLVSNILKNIMSAQALITPSASVTNLFFFITIDWVK